MQQMVNSDSRYGGHPQVDTLRPRVQTGMVPQGQLTTINQSQLNTQLGLNGNNGTHGSPSPPESKSATPSPSSSVHEDDADDAAKVREGALAILWSHEYKSLSSSHTYPHTHTHTRSGTILCTVAKYSVLKRMSHCWPFSKLYCYVSLNIDLLRHWSASSLFFTAQMQHIFSKTPHQYWSSGKCGHLCALPRYFCLVS